jgi:cytochrome b561
MTQNVSPLPARPAPKRYHPLLVVLHWVIAILIFVTALFALGGGEGEGFRLGSPTVLGLPLLGIHMVLGITVLVLLIIRLVIRFTTPQPDWATTGSGLLDKVGVVTHWALYFFVFAITVTGLILALQTNRLARVFNPSAARNFAARPAQPGQFPPSGGLQPGQTPVPGQLPPAQLPQSQFQRGGDRPGGFQGRSPREGGFFLGAFHGLSWILLLLLVAFHIGAALYHQFLRRDGLLGRMWFGRRYA